MINCFPYSHYPASDLELQAQTIIFFRINIGNGKTGTNMGCDCEARKRTESLLSSLSFGKRRKHTTFNFPSPKIFHFRSTTATVGWSKLRIFFLSRSNGTETFGHGFKFHFDDYNYIHNYPTI